MPPEDAIKDVIEYSILYSTKWDPIAGHVVVISDPFIRIQSEDGVHIVRLSDVDHIKIPKDNIEGFERADF